MYSRQETATIKQAFWTSFGQYMKPVPTAAGQKNSWINYKTGIPYIHFRMVAEKRQASIAIEIANPSAEMRAMQFEQFTQLKTLFQNMTGKEWTWQENVFDSNGKSVNRIYQTLAGVNVLAEQDWPAIISFLKTKIIALDAFWEEVKYGFE
ncbi:MAG: hypothetical protein JWQ30_2432 [Sediminibacterium sp.]|nr:hypothetical protein [Sediminibacterium sp.]